MLTGFSQLKNYEIIKDIELEKNWRKFILMMRKLNICSNPELFLHNKVKMILFKKVENPTTYDGLRGIGIVPSWIMTMKKLTLPKLQEVLTSHTSKYQFGFINGKNAYLKDAWNCFDFVIVVLR